MWSTLIALGYAWLAVTGAAGVTLVVLMTVQRLLRRGLPGPAQRGQPAAGAPSSAERPAEQPSTR